MNPAASQLRPNVISTNSIYLPSTQPNGSGVQYLVPANSASFPLGPVGPLFTGSGASRTLVLPAGIGSLGRNTVRTPGEFDIDLAVDRRFRFTERTALSVRGLSAGYGPLQVLDGIDLDVAERERVGLVGLNGHGKSTLMRSVVGLVDWRRGEIESGGRDIMKRPTHRLEMHPDYKVSRRPMPDLLREQRPHFKPLVEAFGYENFSVEGWEADDVIGTLSRIADEAGVPTCVVSTDRDAFQLVSDNVCLMMTPRGVEDPQVYTPERVIAGPIRTLYLAA